MTVCSSVILFTSYLSFIYATSPLLRGSIGRGRNVSDKFGESHGLICSPFPFPLSPGLRAMHNILVLKIQFQCLISFIEAVWTHVWKKKTLHFNSTGYEKWWTIGWMQIPAARILLLFHRRQGGKNPQAEHASSTLCLHLLSPRRWTIKDK